MNAVQTLLIASLTVVSAMVFGQSKEETFASSDPVKSVQVYPNPTNDFLNVKFETAIAKKAVFKIHNIIGNEISVEAEAIDDFEVRFKVKDLHEGYYILAVQNAQSGAKYTYKFLKL